MIIMTPQLKRNTAVTINRTSTLLILSKRGSRFFPTTNSHIVRPITDPNKASATTMPAVLHTKVLIQYTRDAAECFVKKCLSPFAPASAVKLNMNKPAGTHTGNTSTPMMIAYVPAAAKIITVPCNLGANVHRSPIYMVNIIINFIINISDSHLLEILL